LLVSPQYFAGCLKKLLKESLCIIRDQASSIQTSAGFREKRSTATLMLETLNDWTAVLDVRSYLDVICFDFQIASDKVIHSILLHTLVKNHQMDKKFLRERTFQVKIGTSLPKVQSAPRRVPQGSVLSPVLFNIYTFDLPPSVEKLGLRVQEIPEISNDPKNSGCWLLDIGDQ
ncbi:hypothetical protein COOONC_20329, partial [Cooperia oncophora]